MWRKPPSGDDELVKLVNQVKKKTLSRMDVAQWCYKWMNRIGFDWLSLGGVRFEHIVSLVSLSGHVK